MYPAETSHYHHARARLKNNRVRMCVCVHGYCVRMYFFLIHVHGMRSKLKD